MKAFLLSFFLFTTFGFDDKKELCQEKPWICEEKPCPKNEERVMGNCRCQAGFERNKETKECEPILE